MFKNQLKTVILLALLTALVLWIGQFFGPNGLIIAIIFVVIFNFAGYWYSDKIVLKTYRAKEINEKDDPRFYKIVKEVAHLANIPMPKVYIIPSASPNAFATGRNPAHGAVAASTGILELLNNDELKGVMAHEVSHIKHRDTLLQVVVGMVAGVISYVATMAQWAALFGGFGGRDNNNGGNMIQLLVLAIVAPLAASIIQLAISRSREFMADEGAAKMLHSGFGLASALEKLEAGIKHRPMRMGSNSTAHLFISNPFSRRSFGSLFSTHPTTAQRVKKLKDMMF